jgi:protocatechuate 3,4-dioxygenase beta subunit
MQTLATFSMLLLTAAFCQFEQVAAGSVDVELKIVDPSGNVVANKSATFTVADKESLSPKAAPMTATTDSNGVAQFKAPSGVYRLEVSVPGIGYGSTGVLEFVPGQLAKPHLPQLVPFASISGKLLPGLCGAPAKVVVRYSWSTDEKVHQVTPGLDGAFHFADLEAGGWAIWADTRDGSRCAEPKNGFDLTPGLHLNGVILAATPLLPRDLQYQERSETSDRQQEITWVHGRVTDEQGRPISNATVYALGTYHGGIRMYETAKHVSTDQRGYYELKGLGSYRFFSLTLVVKAPGRPPAWAWPEVKMANDFGPRPPAAARGASAVQDFVLSSRSGKLEVTVLQAGKPVVGANVAVYLANANLREQWAAPTGDRSGIEDAAHPVAITDANGVAHFGHLLPGMYGAVATLGSKHDIRSEEIGFENLTDAQKPYALADGIAVQTGETAKFRLAIYPQDTQGAVVIHRADGTPLTGEADVDFGRIEQLGTSTGIELDASGKGRTEFERPGLWHVAVTYRDSPTTGFPLPLPYYAAIGEVAVSPSLPVTTAPVITARRFNNGSVNVRVLDENGQPLHATVEIKEGSIEVSGSTDTQGRIRFEGVPPSDHWAVRALSDGMKPLPQYGRTYSPAANVSQLANRLEILPQDFAVAANQEVSVVLKRELVGYLYGTVKPPAGQNDLSYVRIGSSTQVEGEPYPVFRESGEYFAGPLHAGAVEMSFESDNPRYPNASGTILTTIQPGEAKRINIERVSWKMAPRALTQASDSLLIGAGGASLQTQGAPNLKGKVTMHDGRTAAFGAQVFYFEPGQAAPTIIAMTDALGNLRPRNIPQNAEAPPAGEKVGPDSPLLIAFLPGMCGATIHPAPKPGGAPLRLVLPQPLSLNGNVTADRSALRPGSGSVRVVAEYEGESFLAPWLSVEATADADGNFAIKGLSPGKYQIQAALDNIWLSAPLTVTISEQNPEPVHLAITAPGAAVLIRLRDGDNKPVAGEAITIDREGPLSRLWPQRWVSDGAGVVFVPTLESGKHTIRGKRLAKPEAIEVPPLRTATPVEIVLRLR